MRKPCLSRAGLRKRTGPQVIDEERASSVIGGRPDPSRGRRVLRSGLGGSLCRMVSCAPAKTPEVVSRSSKHEGGHLPGDGVSFEQACPWGNRGSLVKLSKRAVAYCFRPLCSPPQAHCLDLHSGDIRDPPPSKPSGRSHRRTLPVSAEFRIGREALLMRCRVTRRQSQRAPIILVPPLSISFREVVALDTSTFLRSKS